MDTVNCREVIVSTIRRRGNGTEHSPIRIITEVFEKDGTKIAEHDPSPETFTVTDMIHFCRWAQVNEFNTSDIDKSLVNKWLDSITEKTQLTPTEKWETKKDYK